MDLAENCEEDFEAAEYGCGENGIASNAYIEGACAFFQMAGLDAFLARGIFFSRVGGEMIVLGGACDGLGRERQRKGRGSFLNGHTIAGFVKTVGGIAMGGEDYDRVA